jgi:hypothetical protein
MYKLFKTLRQPRGLLGPIAELQMVNDKWNKHINDLRLIAPRDNLATSLIYRYGKDRILTGMVEYSSLFYFWDLRFWRRWLWNVLSPGLWRFVVWCRQYVPPKRRQTSTTLHNVTSQKTVPFCRKGKVISVPKIVARMRVTIWSTWQFSY